MVATVGQRATSRFQGNVKVGHCSIVKTPHEKTSAAAVHGLSIGG